MAIGRWRRCFTTPHRPTGKPQEPATGSAAGWPAALPRPRLLLISRLALLALVSLLVSSCGASSPAEPRPALGGWDPPATTGLPGMDDPAWLYLRQDRPLTAAEPLAEVLLVGDLLLGRSVAGQADPLGAVARELAAADLALGNLEGYLQAPEQAAPPAELPGDPTDGYRLEMPPRAVAQLQQAGLDLLSLANNHAGDGGPLALERTARRLESAGIESLGAGPGGRDDGVLRVVNGVRIAVLAWNAVARPAQPGRPALSGANVPAGEPPGYYGWQPAAWDLAQAVQAVQNWRGQADAVLVLVHWGQEYSPQPEAWQRHAAQQLAAAGADLVVGSHPHVIQPVEVIERPGGRPALAAYSLGNFVFDSPDERAQTGLALRLWLDRQGLRAVQGLPVASGPRPHWLSGEQAAAALERGRPAAQRQAYRCTAQTCRPWEGTPTAEPPAGASGGQAYALADLTGDGEPERILLDGERARIFALHGSQPLWTSPPEWRVQDLAVGDPNDDGRYEVLLALTKADQEGIERSHPFIIGYRGGEYRDVWGGSPVAYPLLEVDLADLDGDGVEELLALEQQPAGGQTAAVWAWNGWGYTLIWRGPAGRYRNLRAIRCDDRLCLLVEKLW